MNQKINIDDININTNITNISTKINTNDMSYIDNVNNISNKKIKKNIEKVPFVVIIPLLSHDRDLTQSEFDVVNNKLKDMSFMLCKLDMFETFLEDNHPDVIVTIGDFKKIPGFHRINRMFMLRTRWVNYARVEDINPNGLYHCYLASKIDAGNFNAKDFPLVSVCTCSYNGNYKLLRPFKSLLSQEYTNWEWIIVDDGSNDKETLSTYYEELSHDPRVKIHCLYKHSGYIGELKHKAFNLSRGKILVELDDDDYLTSDCLSLLVKAYQEHPEVGFVYTDCIELFEKDGKTTHVYNGGHDFCTGNGAYYKQRIDLPKIETNVESFRKGQEKWWIKEQHFNQRVPVNICVTPDITSTTIRHIVSVPNHVRTWRSSTYHAISGHSGMYVCDDYELILRTFVSSNDSPTINIPFGMLHIPKMCYIQYRNVSINRTFTRNMEINKIVPHVENYYRVTGYYGMTIPKKLKELGILDTNLTSNIWERRWDLVEKPVSQRQSFPNVKISVVLTTYKRPKQLRRAIESVMAQTFTDFELIVIGDKCPDMEQVLLDYTNEFPNHCSRIKWWNLYKNYNDLATTPRNYALKRLVNGQYIAYLDDDNWWTPEHLKLLYQSITKHTPNTNQFSFSSFTYDGVPSEYATIICTQPRKFRIDTSTIMHDRRLLEKYGYWKSGKELYAHDWELVSRWVEAKEPYNHTGVSTVFYTHDPNRVDPKKIYEVYNDQRRLVAEERR